MIYTSGSTGQPKGVMVEHRIVLNRRWCAVAALTFDSVRDVMRLLAVRCTSTPSVWEILGAAAQWWTHALLPRQATRAADLER